MKADAKTVESLAAELNAALVRDGVRRDAKVTLKVGSPEWMTDVVHEAHGEFLPDDWRYELIEDAASALADDEPGESPNVDEMYPYTADRTRWLASSVNRLAYCDDAREEFGGTDVSMFDLIGMGMVREIEETYNLLQTALQRVVDEQPDCEDDDDA